MKKRRRTEEEKMYVVYEFNTVCPVIAGHLCGQSCLVEKLQNTKAGINPNDNPPINFIRFADEDKEQNDICIAISYIYICTSILTAT